MFDLLPYVFSSLFALLHLYCFRHLFLLARLQTCYDEKQGAVYYWQPSTNSVVWQKPEGASVAPLASTSSSVKFTIGRDREAPAVQRGKAGMPVVNLRTQASDREKFAQEIAPSSILESDSDTASETSLVRVGGSGGGGCESQFSFKQSVYLPCSSHW